VVSSSDGELKLFDVDGGALIGTLRTVDLRSHNRPFSTGNLIFSPDGTWLFQAAQNGVRAWKLSRLAK
jgi:WD40 repeat protein